MSGTENTSFDLLADVVDNVPTSVKTPFFKAIGNLLGGLTALPAAWAKRPAQAVEDTTAARSTITTILAKAVAENATKDPILMQAAAEIYLPTAVRKVRNRLKVAQSAAEHIADVGADSAKPEAPDDDWMNRFMRFAEDASSERLQDLFGRILAGEVVRPGSFCASTLRAVAELDQSIAKDFSSAWAVSIGDCVDYGPEFQRGDGFSRWKRLSEAGLMAPSQVKQFLPPFNPAGGDVSSWSPIHAGGLWLNVSFKRGTNAGWTHIEFTRAGREIGSLLPPPDYEANIRRAAQRLRAKGIVRIELISAGKSPELLWQSAD